MAKKGGKSNSSQRGSVSNRDANLLLAKVMRPASYYLPMTVSTPTATAVLSKKLWNEVERAKFYGRLLRSPTRPLIINPVKKKIGWPTQVSRPWRVGLKMKICMKRAVRREIMFANKQTGKGARSRRKLSPQSKLRC